MALVTQHDAEKMILDAQVRKINSLSDFMRLYLFILQLAFEHGFISSSTRDGIASSIMVAIQRVANGSDIIVSNYVYAISMRFSTLSNSECWELMKNITSPDEASKFIADIHSWFLKRVEADLSTLNILYKKVKSLGSAFFTTTWKNCYDALKPIGGCLEQGTKIELKSNHDISAQSLFYETISHDQGLTYLDRLEDYIQKFYIETSILVKLNGSKVMKAIVDERKVSIDEEPSDEVKKAQQDYDKAVKRLETLEQEYTKKLEKVKESSKAYNRLYDAFVQEHPDMDEDELEDAFDEFWMTCPEYCPDDYEDVENAFIKAKKRQQLRISACKDKLDQAKDVSSSLKNSMSDFSENITLADVLKEYALIDLAKQGIVTYPSSSSEKSAMVSMIPIESAIEIFLQNEDNKISLTEQEQAYLKN